MAWCQGCRELLHETDAAQRFRTGRNELSTSKSLSIAPDPHHPTRTDVGNTNKSIPRPPAFQAAQSEKGGLYRETHTPKTKNCTVRFSSERVELPPAHSLRTSQPTLRKNFAYRRRRRSPRRSCCRSRRRIPWPIGLRTRPSTCFPPGCQGTSTETARGPALPPRQQLPPLRKCGCARTANQTKNKQKNEKATRRK